MGQIIRFLTVVLSCSLIGFIPLQGQPDTTKPANKILYVESLGIGGFHSLNYERMVFRALGSRILGSVSVGASCLIPDRPHEPEVRFLLLQRANLAFGHKGFYLETGADLILSRGKRYNPQVDHWGVWTSHFTLLYHVGLRYQKVTSGPFIKAYLFRMEDNGHNIYFLSNIGKEINQDGHMYWWGGVALGYSF